MIRKQIYITQEQDRKVKILSDLKGIGNESEIIRNALDSYFTQNLIPQTAWYQEDDNGGFYFSHMESGHSNKIPSTTNRWAKIHGFMVGKDFYDNHGNHFKLKFEKKTPGIQPAVL